MTDVISDLPRDERPRERLLTHGAETLSDAELVALLLGSGVRGKNAIQLARGLLDGGLSTLQKQEPSLLAQTAGIGPAKAARIIAAFEISRRAMSGRPDDPPDFDCEAFGRKLVASCAQYTQERLGAAFLDSRHRLITQREIFIGTINSALVSTRDIVRYALMDGATAIVVYHNHPSGNPSPSADDEFFTDKLRDSLALVDLELIDHLIIGAQRYHSVCGSAVYAERSEASPVRLRKPRD